MTNILATEATKLDLKTVSKGELLNLALLFEERAALAERSNQTGDYRWSSLQLMRYLDVCKQIIADCDTELGRRDREAHRETGYPLNCPQCDQDFISANRFQFFCDPCEVAFQASTPIPDTELAALWGPAQERCAGCSEIIETGKPCPFCATETEEEAQHCCTCNRTLEDCQGTCQPDYELAGPSRLY